MNKVLRIIKFLTIVLFLITILAVYAFLPMEVSLYIDNIVVSKETFFYTVLILFCILNFLFSSLAWFYKRLKAKDAKKQSIQDWTVSLPVPINWYIIFIVAYIGMINNTESVDVGSYTYLLYMGPLLVIIWVVAFVRILIQPKKVAA